MVAQGGLGQVEVREEGDEADAGEGTLEEDLWGGGVVRMDGFKVQQTAADLERRLRMRGWIVHDRTD